MTYQAAKSNNKKENKSGIINDVNDWTIEVIGNTRYPLELSYGLSR
ncbi:hypothetical protein V3564_00910 [Bartonella sp. B12(2025)]